MIECEDEPVQRSQATTIGYIPRELPWTSTTFASPVYFYDNKWWDVDWYGLWFVQEHPELEDEIIFESEEDALLVGA